MAYGNIERGFLFFHQALEDDFKEGFRPYNTDGRSPAWDFVTLNFSEPRQAAGQILRRRADWLNQILSEYQNSGRGALSLKSLSSVLSLKSLSSVLSLKSLGKNVLDERQLMEITFSFTYDVFRSENLLSYPKEFRSGRFASQLALNTLFSLCRIGEMWLTKKQGANRGLLNGQMNCFFQNHHSPITGTDLGNYNRQVDFEECLEKLLNNEQVLSSKNINPWESDFILIYVLRNEAGHAATSFGVISERFNELVERVFFGLFKIFESPY